MLSSQTSKSLNYIDHFLVGPYYMFFMCTWIYLRHYLNLRILWSLLTEFRTVGPFELNWGAEQYKCWISQYITTILLSALQALNLFWLFFIIRIAYRYLVFNVAEDDRSDAEEECEDAADEGEKDHLLANGEASANGRTANSKANGSTKKR